MAGIRAGKLFYRQNDDVIILRKKGVAECLTQQNILDGASGWKRM
mgnify:CR=1 FL=1